MIKKRNLDPSLVAWIMHQTGLGPGIGSIYYTAKTDTAFYQKLLDDGNIAEGNLFALPSKALNGATASRNDIIFVLPGAYDEDVEIAWSKANTHLVGLGGPNTGGDWAEPNVVIYTDATTVASVITVTGANCMFLNATVSNYGDATACLRAFTLDKYGCYFRNMAFQGVMTAGSDGEVEACSLGIWGDAFNPIFDNCIIGQDVWDVRTAAGSGMLNFGDTGGRPSGGWFRNCRFLSNSATAAVAMIRIKISASIGRSWLFDGCEFSNWNEAGTKLTKVIYQGGAAQKTAIRLKNCAAYGFSKWTDVGYGSIMSCNPVATVGGGLEIEPTSTVS